MRSVIAALVTFFCLPKRFERWSLAKRFSYSQRLWRNLDATIKFAIWITVSFLTVIFLFSFASGCAQEEDCAGSKYEYFWSAKPNEVGDTLAGVAGSLAFFWLIVTVVLQGKELSAQRKELRLTRMESAKMADALGIQADVFRNEQKQRVFLQKKDEFEELLKSLLNKSKAAAIDGFSWVYTLPSAPNLRRQRDILSVAKGQSIDDDIRYIANEVKKTYHILDEISYEGTFFQRAEYPQRLLDLLDTLEAIVLLKMDLSRAQQIRYTELRIDEFYASLRDINSRDEFWGAEGS